LSVHNHTLNAVPTIVWGASCDRIARRIKTLADISPTILHFLTEKANARS
jgi:bisphosphoglycerate-independent phosphoglycerate mutase (AlkP superfamily)